MFTATCPAEGSTVLLGPGNITSLSGKPDGFAIHFTCWCGAVGTRFIPARPSRSIPVSQVPATAG